MQNTPASLSSGARRLDHHHSNPIHSLHCLPIRQRTVSKDAILVGLCGNVSVASLLRIYRNSAYRSKISEVVFDCGLNRLPGCIRLPRVQTSIGQRRFRFCGPLIWYSLHAKRVRLAAKMIFSNSDEPKQAASLWRTVILTPSPKCSDLLVMHSAIKSNWLMATSKCSGWLYLSLILNYTFRPERNLDPNISFYINAEIQFGLKLMVYIALQLEAFVERWAAATLATENSLLQSGKKLD